MSALTGALAYSLSGFAISMVNLPNLPRRVMDSRDALRCA